MDTTPEMASIWHMATLTMPALFGIHALLPFFIGILNEFTIQGKFPRVKLVTVLTELSVLERYALREATMWHSHSGRKRWKDGPPGRSKTLMLAHMTDSTDQALLL
jgi:hypothetical protein